MDSLSEIFTGIVVLLAAIAGLIIVPYAARELRTNIAAMRAQFAGALTFTLIGLCYRLGVAYYFWLLSPAARSRELDDIQGHILLANLVLIVGIVWVIRALTAPKLGEWGWMLSIAVATAIVALPRILA